MPDDMSIARRAKPGKAADSGVAPGPSRRGWLVPAAAVGAGLFVAMTVGGRAVPDAVGRTPTASQPGPGPGGGANGEGGRPAAALSAADERRPAVDQPAWVQGVTVTVAETDTVSGTLVVTAVVRVSDPARQAVFHGWRPARPPDRHAPTLTDELGNRYASRPPGPLPDAAAAAKLEALAAGKGWAVGSGQVTSSRPRVEVLVFDRPVSAATTLLLDLPGGAVGVSDAFRFRLPARRTTPAGGPPPRPITGPQKS